jgi:hypothetical protein
MFFSSKNVAVADGLKRFASVSFESLGEHEKNTVYR